MKRNKEVILNKLGNLRHDLVALGRWEDATTILYAVGEIEFLTKKLNSIIGG